MSTSNAQSDALSAAINGMFAASDDHSELAQLGQRLALAFDLPGLGCSFCGSPATKRLEDDYMCSGCAPMEATPWPTRSQLKSWAIERQEGKR